MMASKKNARVVSLDGKTDTQLVERLRKLSQSSKNDCLEAGRIAQWYMDNPTLVPSEFEGTVRAYLDSQTAWSASNLYRYARIRANDDATKLYLAGASATTVDSILSLARKDSASGASLMAFAQGKPMANAAIAVKRAELVKKRADADAEARLALLFAQHPDDAVRAAEVAIRNAQQERASKKDAFDVAQNNLNAARKDLDAADAALAEAHSLLNRFQLAAEAIPVLVKVTP